MEEQPTGNDESRRAMDAEGKHPEYATGRAPAENAPSPQEDLTCAVCGHPIGQDDLVCPNCGVSLAAG